MSETLRTPLYDTHVALKARMVPFGGWDMPVQYEGILAEHEQTRKRAAIYDICHMGEFELNGPTAEADLNRLLTMNVPAITQGQAKYGFLLDDEGGVIDDLTCYRLGPQSFFLVVNAGTRVGDREWIESRLSPTTIFEDHSDLTGKLDVQGPDSRAALEEIFGVKLPDLGYFKSVQTTLGGVPMLLSRTGYTGEWGYELYFDINKTVELWNTITASGRVKPAGLGARDTLRLEVGYPLYGHELGRSRTPVAAFRGMFIDMTKDFTGKAACARDVANGCPQYLCGLKLESKRAARQGDAVVDAAGNKVGEVTSGSVGPSLGIAIAMAYVDAALTAPGTVLAVDVRGTALPATVVPLPFYTGGTARKK